MTNFVLVAGAWLGAWAWDEVEPPLRKAGHTVVPLSLSGLAEKRDMPAETIGQATHVRDIVDTVARLDLHDVVLVGHSYSGIPVGQAAAAIGERLTQVVYVDSNVPAEGRSFTGGHRAMEAEIVDNGGFWAPLTAADYVGQGLTDEAIGRIVGGSTPHPGRSLTEPATLDRPVSELPSTYIKCLLDGDVPSDDVVALLESDQWQLIEMNTGHWPMFSAPEELAQILLTLAR
jgi:pimeloyl-ACP methyl ester carboxylesterase